MKRSWPSTKAVSAQNQSTHGISLGPLRSGDDCLACESCVELWPQLTEPISISPSWAVVSTHSSHRGVGIADVLEDIYTHNVESWSRGPTHLHRDLSTRSPVGVRASLASSPSRRRPQSFTDRRRDARRNRA
jgi:hypothetical protein